MLLVQPPFRGKWCAFGDRWILRQQAKVASGAPLCSDPTDSNGEGSRNVGGDEGDIDSPLATRMMQQLEQEEDCSASQHSKVQHSPLTDRLSAVVAKTATVSDVHVHAAQLKATAAVTPAKADAAETEARLV